ncbi:MAG TPA: hypothetical protein VMJ10_09335 [Kofleriaceae bacterium]|nr:hypothetical protein [Kofleriaceae bacterium]
MTGTVVDLFESELDGATADDPQSFGTVPVGTTGSDVQLTYGGSGTLGTIDQTIFTGTDGSEFSIDPVGTTCTTGLVLPDDGICVVNVRFSPSAAGYQQTEMAIPAQQFGTTFYTTLLLYGTGQ